MGCVPSKEPEKACKLNLMPYEFQHLKKFHSDLSGLADGCSFESLADYWSKPCDQYMTSFMLEYYFGRGRRRTSLNFHRFAELYAKLARGSADEKCAVLCSVLSPVIDAPCFAVETIRVFTLGVITSYVQEEIEIGRAATWIDRGCPFKCSSLQRLAESITYMLEEDATFLSVADLENWIVTWPDRFGVYLDKVLLRMFNFDRNKWPDGGDIEPSLIPLCRTMLGEEEIYPSVLELVDVIHINSLLPRKVRKYWRLLFSTQIHGFDFDSFIAEVTNIGPTVLVVKDSWNYVFGAFAPHRWIESESFYGDWRTFLFTLYPKMRVYRSSGYDENYQILDLDKGLGIGGSDGFHALCILPELRYGVCRQHNLTFSDYQPLSRDQDFQIINLEVWFVGRGRSFNREYMYRFSM